jgi:protein TonB
MMEDKIELGGRDPGLLSPAEDPGRFKRNRTFTASTLKPSVPTTSATTTAKPAPVTPFAVVEPAKPLVELAKTPVAEPAKPAVPETAKPAPFEPAIVSTPAAPAVSMPVPALTTWEESPRENQAKRPWLVPLAAVAAMLVIAVGFWIYSTTSKDAPAPVIPVPGKNAAALPAVAPALPAPAPTAQPPAKTPAAESVKTTKPAETQAAPPAREQEARQPIEIAAGQPKPKEEPEPDVPAPKLSLAAHDPSINSLVRVALPSAPKSDLVPASLVSRVNPLYPSLARQLGVSGTVVMEVKIEKNGSVGAVRVTAGAMQLRQAAIDAVKQWRYKPASLNGSPVESTAEVKVNFIR